MDFPLLFYGKIFRNTLIVNVKSWKKSVLADGIGFFGGFLL